MKSYRERKTHGGSAKRKHRCADCGHMQYLRVAELARRCKPHCRECGGMFLEPTEYSAQREEAAFHHRARSDQQERIQRRDDG